MRFDFSRFLLDIERRFRRFRGLSLAYRLLFYGSLACVAANVGLRWWIPKPNLETVLSSLLAPILLAGAAFLLGWRMRLSVPHLLLQLDDELDSGARISSLYEVRTRGDNPFIRARLESLVGEISTDWKKGIKLPRRSLGFLSAGIAGLLVACALLVLPVPFPRAASSEPPAQSETSTVDIAASSLAGSPQDTVPTVSDEAATPLELSDEVPLSRRDPTEEVTPNRPNEELSLDSILDDLSSLSQGRTQVDAPPTSDQLLELAEAQAQARQTLSDMLRELMEEMQGNPRPLTQQESTTLQDLASQTGDPEIEEQTDEVVDEPNPDQIGEKLQDLLEKADPGSAPPDTSPESDEGNGDGSGQDSPQSTEVSGDEEAGQRFLERTAERLQEEANAESDADGTPQHPTTPEDDAQEPEEDGSTETTLAGDPDDLSKTGGDDGVGGISGAEPPPGEVGFIREEAPSSIGEEGGFVDEFITKGVPVETSPTEGQATIHIIDFERMDSILHERGLPDEALDSVRRYFELITRPEGGS